MERPSNAVTPSNLPNASKEFGQITALAVNAKDIENLCFPEKPEEPLQSDCCGTGCSPCVFDLYEKDLQKWKDDCDKIRRGETVDDKNTRVTCITLDKYHTFVIEKMTTVSQDCLLYKFHIPNNGTLGLQVGQHLVLRTESHNGFVTRQYTPVSELDAKGHFDVLIKLYPHGRMSQFVKTWKVCDQIEWRGPFGDFEYFPNKYQHMVLLAAGTGIAPMVQVIRYIVENECDDSLVHLFYACKTYSDILCKDLLNAWSSYWNFHVIYALSQESSSTNTKFQYGDVVHFGKIDLNFLRTNLYSFSCDKTQVLICGTKSFDKDMINYTTCLQFVNYFKF